jgi:hypothetical protein
VGGFIFYIMLVKDIVGKEIELGDEVIIPSNGNAYKCKIIKETAKSIGYSVWSKYDNDFGGVYWLTKTATPFRNMYKI